MQNIINNSSIAILMATYNAQQYIEAQIDSIINQSNHEWTLYIRDDGSKDSTTDILTDYENKYSNIIVIRDEKGNLGCKDNFFELLLSVSSKYYMFSDADDVWLPDKIELEFVKIRELELLHPSKPIIIHTDMIVVDSQLNVIYPSMWRAGKSNPDRIKSYDFLAIHGYVGGATMLFNDAAKSASLPINHNVYMHDLWIGLSVVKKGVVYSLHTPTILYRQHSNNSVGGAVSKQLMLKYKIANIGRVIKINCDTYRMLRKIGYGSILKYLYYKCKLVFLMRSGKMFK